MNRLNYLGWPVAGLCLGLIVGAVLTTGVRPTVGGLSPTPDAAARAQSFCARLERPKQKPDAAQTVTDISLGEKDSRGRFLLTDLVCSTPPLPGPVALRLSQGDKTVLVTLLPGTLRLESGIPLDVEKPLHVEADGEWGAWVTICGYKF